MKKVALIGSIGYGESTSSGQVIRTRILYKALLEHYGSDGVYMINTSDYSHHALSIIGRTVCSLFSSDTYIVILSGNGRKVFFPVLRFFKKAFGKNVLNNIIGGDYASSVRKYPKYIEYSNAFDVNWVQMPSMKIEVEQEGIHNVEVLPNSKPLVIVSEESLEKNSQKPFQFCTFSRVSKAKGIELAINAIEQINRKTGETVAELTIYGKPDDDYAQDFKGVMDKATEAIKYGGVIDYDKASDELRKYYMLLFPTTFYGEGFPGTIIDAYSSGVPVIASDWKFNPELIESGRTGYIYDHEKPEELVRFIRMAIENPADVDAMRKNCIKEAKKYTPENVMPIIFTKIDSYRK
jgi:glycosyltransferase involved in cell wall biosynthesis